jgi:hypothetical protein
MWKIFLILSFVFLATSCEQRNKNKPISIIKPFTLIVIVYNHADRLIKGESKYVLNENKLVILNIATIGGKETVLISKDLTPTNTLVKLSTMKIDTLKDFYNNTMIMPTSGDEINIEFRSLEKVKEIHLHSYYNEQIKFVISLLNELTPDEYKIRYDKPIKLLQIVGAHSFGR